ncbi:hypothetical protein K2173_011332 [Erythroxylum novogranatense]|uniref:LNK2 n=1 Tax=Erythroxylum novogranatense TaxID=1862640 RepID=A0AAV8S9B4_9ROSI|nr:hypothetical protein K2173_011332 [Erythroxylum novogranatense]
MFDWNDEELTNIIWGEAGESDDHIVPYPEATDNYSKRKQWSEEDVKSTRQKVSTTKVDMHGTRLKNSSNFEISEGTYASGSGMHSWHGLPVSHAVKTDQDSLGTSVSNNLINTSKVDSSRGEIAELDNVTGMFKNPQEAKEQGDFVDYGWANIGSFDDLDQIFRNDDSIFGSVSLPSADELWSSSKDVTNSPVKPFPMSVDSPNLEIGALRNTSEHFGIKTEYLEDDQPFSPDHGKLNDPVTHGMQSVQQIPDHIHYSGNASKPLREEQTEMINRGNNSSTNCQLTSEETVLPNELASKVHKQKKFLKSRKKLEENIMYQDVHGNWSSPETSSTQLKNHYVAPILQSSSSTVFSEHKQLQGANSLQFHQISNPFVAPSAYGGVASPYTAIPMMSHIHSREFNPQSLLSGYEASSGNMDPAKKMAHSTDKGQIMTPREKIEKLRKRQQMQALLAIQKQQQQFVHQVACCNQPIRQHYSQENGMQDVEGAIVANIESEELSSLPAFDPSSPIEQDNSSVISLTDNDFSLEDTVLFQLQDIIAKLNVGIRLCMRDSLFRLAQSALQRQCTSDTSSTNNGGRDEQVVKEETAIHNRNSKMREVETETNPIDRTVAHLLFHRPVELSGKHPSTPESPVSTKLSSEHKREGTTKLSASHLQDMKHISEQGSKSSCLLDDPESICQRKTNICFDMSENGSNNGPAGAREVEASQ